MSTADLSEVEVQKSPKLRDIDALVARIERLTKATKPTAKQQQAQKDLADARAQALSLTQQFGEVPKSASSSKRLSGRKFVLTATTGTVTTQHPEAVQELLLAMRKHDQEKLFATLFTPSTTYHRAKDAANNLLNAELPKRLRELFDGIFARTASESSRAPVLRIDPVK